jgi:hypothetical protein
MVTEASHHAELGLLGSDFLDDGGVGPVHGPGRSPEAFSTAAVTFLWWRAFRERQSSFWWVPRWRRA